METFVTLGLVLKETRYKESDRILTILTPGLGVISASAQSSLRLKKQIVQRVRAVLLFGIHAGAGAQHVYCARSGRQECLSRHFFLHRGDESGHVSGRNGCCVDPHRTGS